MAFMEKPPAGKVLLDDTVPLTAAIEASQSLQSHTEYIIRVQRGISVENSWQIVRRYSDFDLLNNSLQIAGLSLPLPPKKLIGNMDREFIAERQKGLQNYLNVITTNHILSNCELVKKFLDPNNYSASYTEIALQQVSMFFRSEPKWEVVEPLKDIGWRIRKKYFLMKIKNQPKERLVLSWHPYIYRVTFATANESSALLIRMFNEKGTLKDLIYKAKPKDPFLRKYCNPKKIQGLELQQIKTYGRQILEVLKFLHDKGFPYGHLHASNVMLEGDACRLLDLENSLLGLPSFYRSYFSQFRKINTLESVDVHCFGHLLYEMTYGRPPDSVPVDSFPPAPSMAVVAVLESTLSCEACKNGMPTVSRLLQMPLFSDVLLTTSEKPQFKIPTKLKEALRIAKECIEKRLIEEQKQIHQHRRLTRAQSHHGSEEERKKRKILARKKSKRSAVENSEEHSAKYSNSNNSAGSGASSPLTSPSSPTPPSTAGMSALPPPPPPAPPPPAAPLPPASTEAPTQLPPQAVNGVSRGALLSSIQNFQKGTLRKAETCDHSAPKIG
ncbi:PX domain-containing protein kinase-like protein isoform X4 [Lagenorhynchus albirostris]|uniref:PX domain-containing protein kinase-like protein isoform X4 n=1 Tax=Sagmatias obliquidens TaxID=3371155 RepID=UPI000F4417BF|nr:PX domain-containing protein kinase-like protein isoform X4 [Lagenorhynchus obliquidens]XP_030723402.1 PX domain-containing protein kinase-like protein isoform X4 [Globicephala melas]XP_059878751.1 PX domain-containing protein kinase-like protein isoform X7 [Delphinus delphis]XP_060017437.1 PX domain-containing protein kinase-like protein isoform X4 [Lagenorhynchus albirostris]